MVHEKQRKNYNNTLQYNGQAFADKFVLNCSGFKKNGYFLELGSRDPKITNNSYILEKEFGWTGFLIDREQTYELDYKTIRTNSIPVIKDATKIDYKNLFKQHNVPSNLDFWQLDLEVRDNTALKTLIKIDNEILDEYKFAIVTMEHDVYTGLQTSINTRIESRKILEARGYYLVFSDILDPPDVCIDYPYEDWWVHPELVDMGYITQLQMKNRDKYMKVNTKVGAIDCFKSYEIEY